MKSEYISKNKWSEEKVNFIIFIVYFLFFFFEYLINNEKYIILMWSEVFYFRSVLYFIHTVYRDTLYIEWFSRTISFDSVLVKIVLFWSSISIKRIDR